MGKKYRDERVPHACSRGKLQVHREGLEISGTSENPIGLRLHACRTRGRNYKAVRAGNRPLEHIQGYCTLQGDLRKATSFLSKTPAAGGE